MKYEIIHDNMDVPIKWRFNGNWYIKKKPISYFNDSPVNIFLILGVDILDRYEQIEEKKYIPEYYFKEVNTCNGE